MWMELEKCINGFAYENMMIVIANNICKIVELYFVCWRKKKNKMQTNKQYEWPMLFIWIQPQSYDGVWILNHFSDGHNIFFVPNTP